MWHRIISFEISAKKRTRRGSVGGKRHVNATTINDNDNLNRSSNLPAVFMTNAQSVNNKMDELEVILRQEQIDICVITETWFKPDMPSSQTDINGFSMFSKSRDSRGGGVAIYVKNSIPTNELDIIVPQELECIWVQVRPYRLPRGVSAVVFCVIYILTDSPLQPLLAQHVTDTVDQLRSRYPELGFCITGDFNRMDITPITLGNHLKQLVTFPTRGRATLDLLITNIEPHYHDPSPYSNIGKSDHASVVWKPKSRLSQNTIKTRVTRPFPFSLTIKQSLTIERIQKRACKIILGYNKFISYQKALNTLNLQPLSTRRESHCLIFAGSLNSCSRTSGLLPPRRKEVHGRSLRNDNEYSRLQTRTERYANSPVPFFVRLLNK